MLLLNYIYNFVYIYCLIFTGVKIGFALFPLTPVMAFLPVDSGNPEKDFHSSVYILDKYSACYQYRP